MKHVTIFHTNDLHNRREVFSFLKKLPRDENTLLLDAGDALGGSNTLFYLKEPIISLMNEVGYTAMAMGNREFNYFRGVLKRRYESAHFPVLSANVKDLRGTSSFCWTDHLLLDIAGIRIAITGLSPVQFSEESFLTRLTGFLFIPPEAALEKLFCRLRGEKVNLVIVLSHLGVEHDERLAENFDDIGLIIGGHSHTLLREPKKIKGAYIVQAGCYGSHVGKISLTFKGQAIDTLDYELLQGASSPGSVNSHHGYSGKNVEHRVQNG